MFHSYLEDMVQKVEVNGARSLSFGSQIRRITRVGTKSFFVCL